MSENRPTPDRLAHLISDCLNAWDWVIESTANERSEALVALRTRLLYVKRVYEEQQLHWAALVAVEETKPEPQPLIKAEDPELAALLLEEEAIASVALDGDTHVIFDGSQPRKRLRKNQPDRQWPFERGMNAHSPYHVACPDCGADKYMHCYAIKRGKAGNKSNGIDRYQWPFTPNKNVHLARTVANKERLAS